jgi:hypothetical protein
MRARHEEQDLARHAQDSISCESLQGAIFEQVTARHSLSLALETENRWSLSK